MFISAIGQDSHRFAPESTDKPLVLGGVRLPDTPGLAGNSDADVILHALCNALSGLSGTNILGARTDVLCTERGITDSRVYVREALSTLKGIEPVHVSVSVEASRPLLHPYIDMIRQSIAGLLSLPVERVGLTATSGEGLTAFGRGEGIQALVVVSARSTISEG
ncbi:MAG: 2-C-methyl-D-erythritol 2,4-cyclodiphosphate synthase [Chitinispirillaceae bacterium]|nr:2-C-methyl-D-erythritol 2,4-cyclodiphosphate synthase [Chitinispirillaceae bacterium]